MIYYLSRHWGPSATHPPPARLTASQNNNSGSGSGSGDGEGARGSSEESMCSTCTGLMLDRMPVCCLWPEACTLGCVLELGGKFPMPPYPGMMVINDYASPPPAHMGIGPVHHDPKTGLPRPPMYTAYATAPGQFPHPIYGPEFAQWHRPAGYPISSSAFSGSYPPLLNTSARFGPPGLLGHPGLPHPGIPHPAIIPPGGPKQEYPPQGMGQDNHRAGSASDRDLHCSSGNGLEKQEAEKKKPYVKKPLNAFMLFMKEMRAKVIAECTLKESAAINQILGRKWHALDRSEQAKYYEMARKEKELHMQLYPGWSARDNYASHQKKKKRKREGSTDATKECTISKKCRARFGMEQQNQWCKPCRSLHEKCDQATADLDTKKSTDV